MLIFCVLLFGLSAFPNEVALSPIVGGHMVQKSNASKYPFMVSLQEFYNFGNGTFAFQHFCGGSLINSKWILTAAHCLHKKELRQVFAVIGSLNLKSDVATRYALDRVEFTYFIPNDFSNDIALVHLKHSYKSPKYPVWAQLPVRGMRANRAEACTIMGYGAMVDGGAVQQSMREGKVYVIRNRECRKALGFVWGPQNGSKTFCAGGQDNQDTCQGDSGGPLLCNYAGQAYIYGIVSHGLNCGTRGVPSVYTATIPYLEWINLVANT